MTIGSKKQKEMSILNDIADKTRERIEIEKEGTDISILLQQIEELKGESRKSPAFSDVLKKNRFSVICEVKKAAPGEGMLTEKFHYLETAEEFEAGGAAAVSVLTEPFYFEGSDQYLWEIAGRVKIPVLRRDYVIDEYMLYQAKALGASAVNLIPSILDDSELKSFMQLSEELGMDVLTEVFSEEDVERALKAEARIIGVNNRTPDTFEIDKSTCIRLRKMIPDQIIYVAESGIKTPEDIGTLRANNIHAALIGEAVMKSDDRGGMLKAMLREGD